MGMGLLVAVAITVTVIVVINGAAAQSKGGDSNSQKFLHEVSFR